MPNPIQSTTSLQCTWDPDDTPVHTADLGCEGPGPLACYAEHDAPVTSTPSVPQGADGVDSSGSHPDAVRTLCEHRLATNVELCNILGSVAAARVGGPIFAQALLGRIIGEGCVRAADWAEANAPGGACGKE